MNNVLFILYHQRTIKTFPITTCSNAAAGDVWGKSRRTKKWNERIKIKTNKQTGKHRYTFIHTHTHARTIYSLTNCLARGIHMSTTTTRLWYKWVGGNKTRRSPVEQIFIFWFFFCVVFLFFILLWLLIWSCERRKSCFLSSSSSSSSWAYKQTTKCLVHSD